MTRIIIFGDLHANWEALIALQQAERRPDAVVCLGDIVGYGPDPKQCLDVVRNSVHYLIKGKHDQIVGGSAPAVPVDNPLLEATWAHTRALLPAQDRDYLSSRPTEQAITIAGTRFYMTRLQPDDLETESHLLVTMSQKMLRAQFAHLEADIILVGGPHIPAMRQIDRQVIVCPGSLGLPRYGVPDPTFVAWEDGRLQIHHLHYHPQPIIQKLSLLPLDPEHITYLQTLLQKGHVE